VKAVTNDSNYCFDYSIPLNDGETQLGKSVADSVERCLKFLAPILSPHETSYLKAQAAIALARPNRHRTNNRADYHPISNALADNFPVYAGLAHYTVTTDDRIDGVYPGEFLGDIARFALLLRYLGLIKGGKPNNKDLAAFARKISKAPQDAKEVLYSTCVDFLDIDFDVSRAIHGLTLAPSKSIAHTNQRGKVSTLHGTLISTLELLRPFIELRQSQIENNLITDRKLLQFSVELAAKIRTDVDSGSLDTDSIKSIISMGDDDGPNIDITISRGELNDEPKRSLTQHHRWIRYNNLISGSGRENALHNEVRSVLIYLLGYKATDQYEIAAQWIYILTILNGRPFDAIAEYFFRTHAASNFNGQIALISQENNIVTISIHHPIESNLSVPEGASNAHQLIQIRTYLPESNNSDLALNTLLKIVENNGLDKLLVAKEDLRKKIREFSYSEFTESRVRGRLVHSVLTQNYDLPLAQLIFDEPLSFSFASLHYLAVSNIEIQNVIDTARLDIFGDTIESPPPAKPDSSGIKVGSLIAQKYDKALKETAKWFQDAQQELYRRGRQPWIPRHNSLAELTQHIVFISTAHRGYTDFRELKLHDLSLAAGLGIYRDKPSDPTLLRRLVVLSKNTLTYIFIWIGHLKALIVNKSVPEEVKLAAKNALNSTSSLFFSICPNDGISTFSIDPVEVIRKIIPDANANIARHVMSTQLRRYDLKAMMIETHLGHNLALTINNPNGLISPIDLHTEISPALDLWLHDTGYPAPPPCKIPTRALSILSPKELAYEETENDVKKIRKFLKVATKTEKDTQTVIKLTDSLLTEHLGANAELGSSPPNPQKLTEIRKALIEELPAKPLLWAYACRVLQRKLRASYRNRGWKIPNIITFGIRLPPPPRITRGHIIAYESLAQIRAELLSEVRHNLSPSLSKTYSYAVFALVIFGPCQTFDQAKLWLKTIKKFGHDILQGSITFDLDEAHGSRSISGVSALLVSSWIRQQGTKKAQFVSSVLKKYSLSYIEECVTFASRIEYPPIFADILCGELNSRELPTKRAREYFDNTCNPDIASMSNAGDTPMRVKYGEKRTYDEQEVHRHYIQLKKLIKCPPPRSPEDSRKVHAAIFAIRRWETENQLPLLIAMLASWAKVLLKPGSNLKSGGKLLQKTVSAYIGDVYITLVEIPVDLFSSGNDDDADTLSELIDIALTRHNAVTDKSEKFNRMRVISVSRFIKEMAVKYKLPDIRIFSATDSLLSIDANIITDDELAHALHHLKTWSKSTSITPSGGHILVEATKALALIHATGLRRSEALGTPPITHSRGNKLAVKVRSNATTSLKTPAAWRNIEINEHQCEIHPGNNKYMFPGLAEGGNRHYALSAIKLSLQLATGNTEARLHHNRHTVGTTNLKNLLLCSLPSDRLIAGCVTASNLGHATIRSTTTYYGHLNHHIISQFNNKNIFLLDHQTIAAASNAPEATIRQRWRRCRNKPTSFIWSCIATDRYLKLENKTTNRVITIVSNPPYQPKTKSEVISLRYIVAWVVDRMRGIPLNQMSDENNYSAHITSALLDQLSLIQTQVGAKLVDYQYLESEISILNAQSTKTLAARSARLPKEIIDPLVSKISEVGGVLPSGIVNSLTHITWRGKKKITVVLMHNEAMTLSDFLTAASCGLLLEAGEGKNCYTIKFVDSGTFPLTNKYIRIVILAIIIMSGFNRL
jgi:integrase